MNASDLKRITELVDTYASTVDYLDRFKAIPETAEKIHILIRWPNPEPDAPGFQKEITFGQFLPMGDRTTNPVMDAIRTQLEAEVRTTGDALRALGVNPDA